MGSGDAFGNGGRFQTCIRVQVDGFTALVDCGATTLTAMKTQQLDPGEVDAVVITHLHGDHFGGLPFLILDGQFTKRTKPLTVFGPDRHQRAAAHGDGGSLPGLDYGPAPVRPARP